MANSKRLKWITYLVNMLVALPVMGLISCGVFFVGYDLLFRHSNPPAWAQIGIPVLLGILFTTLYGIHQYRNIILEYKEIRRIRNPALLGGIVLFCFVWMTGVSLLGQGKVNDPPGWLLSMLFLLMVPAVLVVRLFRRLSHTEKGWYWNTALYLLSIGYVTVTSWLAGTMFARSRFDIPGKEHSFFWNVFRDALVRTGDLKKAAEFMLTPDVHSDVLQYIRLILREYELKRMILTLAGAIVLTVVFMVMTAAPKWKYRAWVSAAGLGGGLLLIGFGCYYSGFSTETEKRLTRTHSFQEKTMCDMKSVKPAVSDNMIRMLIDKHQQEGGFSTGGQRLIPQIEGKKEK